MIRRLSLTLTLLAMVACKSHRDALADTTLNVDSVKLSSYSHKVWQWDSIASKFEFEFDSICVDIQKQEADLPPQSIRIKAVGGKISSVSQQQKLAAENHQRLDSLAYKLSAAESSEEHSASTRVYDPPNLTIPIIVALLILAALAYILLRKRI